MNCKILHVIRTVDPSGGGPVEALKQVSRALVEMGHAVEAASLDAPGAAWLKDFPLTLHPLGEDSAVSRGGYGFSKKFVPWLLENHFRYDAVISHGLWQYNNAGVRQALRGTHTPYFVFPHGMLDPWFRRAYPVKHLKKWVYWMGRERAVLRDASAVIFTCEEECRLARKTFPFYRCAERVIALGTSAPPAQEAGRRCALFFETFPTLRGKNILLFLGRLHDKKGCDLLIEAFGKTAGAAGKNHHLVMAGPGADEAYLQKLRRMAEALCPPGSVSFPGMLTGDLKWGAFYAAEAFVLPSHQENFGIAVAEALACGLPVLISNKVNIWREIAGAGAGLVEPDDSAGTQALLEKWMRLPEAGRAGMRAAAGACFSNHFQIQKSAQGILDLIASSRLNTARPHVAAASN